MNISGMKVAFFIACCFCINQLVNAQSYDEGHLEVTLTESSHDNGTAGVNCYDLWAQMYQLEPQCKFFKLLINKLLH